jgi:hypothetical protein
MCIFFDSYLHTKSLSKGEAFIRAFAFKKEKKVSHELHQLSLISIKFKIELH